MPPTGNNNGTSQAMFLALAALQVRDTVALVLLMSMHDNLLIGPNPREVITQAFELADEFAYQSQGRWAIDAKKARDKK